MSEPRKRPSLGAAKLEGRPEVDVLGRAFAVKAVTRSVQTKLAEMDAEMDAAETADQEFAIVADRFDVLLAPIEGQRKKASEFLLDAWQADQLAAPDVLTFFKDVLELAADRPT